MKRIYLLSFALIFWATASWAQESLTLQQCIDYALEHSVEAKNAQLDEEIANSKVKESRGIGLPQVDGHVGLTHNQKLPRFFSTYATAQGFAGEDTNGDPNLDIPGLSPDDILASQNFFQLKSSGDAGITVNQLLFNSSYLVGLRAANAYRELSRKESNQTKTTVVANVSKAYYACLVTKDGLDLFESNVARVDSMLQETRSLHEQGFVEEIDVDRIKVSLNNLIVERDKFIKRMELSYQMLKFQMNYPLDKELVLVGQTKDIVLEESLLDQYNSEWSYSNRAEYQVLESNRELQTLNIKNKYAESMPSLSAFANLGYQTQSANIGGLFKTETNFDDNGIIGPDKWYPYLSFGLNLNIPIFSGLQRTYRIQQEKLTLQKIEHGFSSMQSSIDLEIRTAIINYSNASQTAKAQQESKELAEKIARVTQIKYQEGVGSNLEVIQAEADLREAQTNYYNALYDVAVAKIDLQKAYGKLEIPQSTEE